MLFFKLHTRATELAFAQQREVDPFGHRLHAALGALWCMMACWPTSIVEIGLVPILLCFAIRVPRHLAADVRLVHLTTAQVALAWIAWLGLSTNWSGDRTLGLDELAACRFALSLVMLWPVLDRRSWLIGGLVLGFFMANLGQAAHAVGTAMNLEWLRFPRMPHRNSGWWQPVVGGSMLTAALGLHLPALLTGSLRARVLGFVGTVASLLGVLATGSRGAWLASAALIVLALLWAAQRGVRSGARGRAAGEVSEFPAARGGLRFGHLPLIVAVVFLVGFVGYHTVWPSLRDRAVAGVHEVQRAVDDRDYSTDTGARILMAEVAIQAAESSPVRGVGAGGFRAWGRNWLLGQKRAADAERLHNHAHNTILHAAATTGAVGAVLLVTLVAMSLRGGIWRPPIAEAGVPVDAGNAASQEPLSGYAMGPLFALLGLVLVSPFDVVTINAQTSAVFWILVTLCLWGRPSERR